MSNFLAIATVTAALRSLALEAVQADLPGATVTMTRPGEPGAATGIPNLGVNLFLFQTKPIGTLRNEALPARSNGSGRLMQRPAATFELHYLISFYGDDAALESQRLMGSLIARLTAEPILTGDRLDTTIASPQMPFLAGSDLPEQIDRIKFSPMSTTTEEMARIWSVFFQTRYALSMVWKATAVVIEPQLRPFPALPVREHILAAFPIRPPAIIEIVAASDSSDPITPSSNVLVRGERLRSDDLEILVGGNPVAPTSASDFEIAVPLPGGLIPGPQSIQIRHRMQLGQPPTPHPGIASNAAEFLLHPEIAQQAGVYQIALSNQSGAGAEPRDADVTITHTSSIGRRQLATLELLSEPGAGSSATVRYTIYARERTTDTTQLVFEVRGIVAGSYLARTRIDGAESPLELDPNPANPTFDQPIAPTIVF